MAFEPSDLWSASSAPQQSLPQSQPQPKKKHVCPTCRKAFTTSGHLSRHTRVHTGERNHKCPFPGCETRCSRQDNLQQHYRIHLSPGSRRTSGASARNSLSQNVMVINGPTAGVRKRGSPKSGPQLQAQVDSPPSTPPPLEQAFIAPILPPPELTSSHAYLTSRPPLQFDALGVTAPPLSLPQSFPTTSRPSHVAASGAYPDLTTFAGTTSSNSHMTSAFDGVFGSAHMPHQSQHPQNLPSLGSIYPDDPLAGGAGLSYASQMPVNMPSMHSDTPSPVPSTLSVSSHGSPGNGFYDGRPLDTNGLAYPIDLTPSDRYQPPPLSTAYMSLHALDNAHQAAAAWHAQIGGGRSIHGPSARLMRA